MRVLSLDAFHERLSALDQLYIQASYNMYIDVLPSTVGKGNAVCFLQNQLGLHPDQVVVAGDQVTTVKCSRWNTKVSCLSTRSIN